MLQIASGRHVVRQECRPDVRLSTNDRETHVQAKVAAGLAARIRVAVDLLELNARKKKKAENAAM